ncbi:hypothetical protein F8G81_00785 [Arthrobacter sp. CDRTa11]|nr:hypothetical protein F8G81_00785 [Arthrobacter sp. CDRTa11]
MNQFRDNYSKRIIEIQLTNNTADPVTVMDAELDSALFSSGISWHTPADGTVLPPKQPKSLPAQLPEPKCTETIGGTGKGSSSADVRPTVRVSTRPDSHGSGPLTAEDPFGVLARNNSEMCLDKAVREIAAIQPSPELTVSGDGATAVVHVLIVPGPAVGGQQMLTIDRIDGTTLIAEDAAQPWPRSVQVSAGGPPVELRLAIRPARCDPHAVAEDKIGTLLPFRVTAGGRNGVLKIDTGDVLRHRIYEFVTAACATSRS